MVENTTGPMEARRERIGEFVLAIRRDLLRRNLTRHTELQAADYVHIAPGK